MSKKDTGGEVVLSEELVASYLAAREKDIGTSKLFYFEHIMPRFRKPLEEIEEHKRVAAREFETLVSLMGFSPETTVQACIVVRPKKLVVIGSDGDNARAAAKPAFEYLQREGLIDPFNDLTQIRVDAFDPESIYKSLQENIRGLKNVLLDITGGTKVMSFTAGAFAWEEKLPVCYLNGGWDPQRGAAGLAKVSRLEIMNNPSRLRGDQYRSEGINSFRLGNFKAAEERFTKSAQLIEDCLFDMLGESLSQCYGALVDFDGQRLNAALDSLERLLNAGGIRRLLSDQQTEVDDHVTALREFADGDMLARMAAFAELAEIYTRQGRYDFAGLLWHRSMEALIEWRLREIAPSFRMNKPDWGLLAGHLPSEPRTVEALESAFAGLSGGAHGPLPPRVTLLAGFGLLCILTNLAERFPSTGSRSAIEQMMHLTSVRNQSYLAHGQDNLTEEQTRRLKEGTLVLAKAILGDEFAEFEMKRQHLRPLDLGEIQHG